MRNSTLSDQLIEILETFPEVDLAVLFGSLARGTMSGESDIDLALRLKADTPDVRRRLGGALGLSF